MKNPFPEFYINRTRKICFVLLPSKLMIKVVDKACKTEISILKTPNFTLKYDLHRKGVMKVSYKEFSEFYMRTRRKINSHCIDLLIQMNGVKS